MTIPDATAFLLGQTAVPGELRTADWQRVPLWLRERSFFMAGVDDAETLDVFYRASQAITSGELSQSEAAARIHDHLQARGYRPQPGQEHTIKDLRARRRIDIALQTNVDSARGYGAWTRQQRALAAFPAVRYYRGRQAMVPRDWPAKWRAALAATTPLGATPGASEQDMVALANHPLWTDPVFNELGSPWTPFAFGSGMITAPVSRAQAQKLGLLPEPGATGEDADTLRHMLQRRDRSLNDGLQATPAATAQPVRDALAERLRGFAQWQGDKLIFTDPNGTKPGTPAQIADTITAPLPVDPSTARAFPRHQYDALTAFAADPAAFADPAGRYRNRWTDLARLMARTAGPAGKTRFLAALADHFDDPGPLFTDDIIPRLLRSAAWRDAQRQTAGIRARVEALLTAILDIL